MIEKYARFLKELANDGHMRPRDLNSVHRILDTAVEKIEEKAQNYYVNGPVKGPPLILKAQGLKQSWETVKDHWNAQKDAFGQFCMQLIAEQKQCASQRRLFILSAFLEQDSFSNMSEQVARLRLVLEKIEDFSKTNLTKFVHGFSSAESELSRARLILERVRFIEQLPQDVKNCEKKCLLLIVKLQELDAKIDTATLRLHRNEVVKCYFPDRSVRERVICLSFGVPAITKLYKEVDLHGRDAHDVALYACKEGAAFLRLVSELGSFGKITSTSECIQCEGHLRAFLSAIQSALKVKLKVRKKESEYNTLRSENNRMSLELSAIRFKKESLSSDSESSDVDDNQLAELLN